MSTRRVVAALAVWLGVIAGVVAGVAPAASAHALLLRAEPSPQSTVPVSPSVVRLFFSEAVEVAPGDVRVYDVNGARVDKNKVSRTDGDREVDAEVPHLADGTYTVTWKAVSADTHAVRGGFVFYVGHPSTISPVAITGNTGASRGLGFAYGVDRFLWFAALLAIIGLVVLRRWAWTPAVRAADETTSDAASVFRRSFGRWLLGGWAVLALAGVLSLYFQVATVNGTGFLDAFRSDAVRSVINASFGHFWLLQTAFTVVLLLPVAALSRSRRLFAVPPDDWIGLGGVLVAGLCVVRALMGHARTDPRPALSVASIAVHLATVGVWVGGLGALVVVALPAWRRLPSPARAVVAGGTIRRFSAIAMIAAGIVVVTGTINSIAGFSAVSDLWRYPYGRVVLAKIVLVGLALLLAARHRFVTQARLRAEATNGDAGRRELSAFSLYAGIELLALVAAVALAAALVGMVPGRTLALAANGPVNVQHHAGSYDIQLIVDPTAVGENQIHVTFVGSNGLAAGDVTNVEATLAPPTGEPDLLDMQLIGPGHFVATADLPRPGRYTVAVKGGQTSTIFRFTIRKGD
jgi:copper transport protein